MDLVTVEQWRKWAKKHRILPFVRKVDAAPAMPAWIKWWRHSPVSALLETGKQGRYTFLCPSPGLLLTGDATGLTVTALQSAGKKGLDSRSSIQHSAFNVQCFATPSYPHDCSHHFSAGSPLFLLRQWLSARSSPIVTGAPPFIGGLIGYLSYDLARLLERLPERAERDLDIPLFRFVWADRLLAYDHLEQTLYAAVLTPVPTESEAIEELHAMAAAQTNNLALQWFEAAQFPARKPGGDSPSPQLSDGDLQITASNPVSTISREEFIQRARKIQEYIASGDTYQVNLSVRQDRPLSPPPELVYEKLRQINPSPYMALLRFPELTAVSNSPELLARLHGRKLEARPIAGTRPRGDTTDVDQMLQGELIASQKERAEHLMLVDLLRNDLGRVSRFGTVSVPEFMIVERYSHVMHIVSHIESVLAEGKDAFDVIAAIFPGGTITGAPKVRTMEIIEEVEPARRGLYTGSIGWISPSGDMELNIAIRTLVAIGGRAYVQAGAGIVADSIPENEYIESLDKARAIWAAINAAERAMASDNFISASTETFA